MKERAERYRVSFRVIWDDGESYYTGAVFNISETGLFLETTMDLAIGQTITIMPLEVEGDTGGLFELVGRVVRRDEEAVALQFEALRPAALEDLRRLLTRYRVA